MKKVLLSLSLIISFFGQAIASMPADIANALIAGIKPNSPIYAAAKSVGEAFGEALNEQTASLEDRTMIKSMTKEMAKEAALELQKNKLSQG